MLGPELNAVNWILASLPVALLIATILWRKWSAPRAGGAAWLLAFALAVPVFGANANHVAIASAKGLSLALFVLSIVWTSVYMFNLVDKLDGIKVIGRTMAKLADDRLAQALLVAWGFASFIQGVTGFGVPVAVAAPLLIMLGFKPVHAAAMALVGHGWAVTFGSMGSSYYTIQLVTGFDGDVIGPHMALLSGIAVAAIHGGLHDVRRSLVMVVIAGSVMASLQVLMARLGAPQIASSVPAIFGMMTIALLTRTPLFSKEDGVTSPEDTTDNVRGPMSFWLAFLPYLLLITLSVISQIGPVKDAVKDIMLALDYPGFETSEGFVVAAARNYAPIRILNHPAPLIMISVLLSALAIAKAGRWKQGAALEAATLTYNQTLSTTLGVSLMVMMAVLMADTGMTVLLAQGIANASGPVFPLVSPFIGLLGAFMSGSNTNSNVMFGLLQVETARALDIGPVTIASIQSIGASVGSTMAPTKVLVAAAVVGLAGQEDQIFRKVTVAVLALVALTGVEALILVTLFENWTR
ncbi:MAG: L-lactate permease [Chloroflexi bacterium]|nr:L-lactate permease [Chloroflexota bacterium]